MFTVVVPLYNKESTIVETLKSVLNQTFSNFEIIVVNDGSTDRSREKAAELTDSRIKIIDQPNGGISIARNRAIQLSAHPYIALLDADDLWVPEYLEEQRKMIADFPDAKMWGVAWNTFRKSKRFTREHGIDTAFREYVDSYFTMEKRGHLFMPSAIVLDKQALTSIGLFDPNIRVSEDLDLFFRMLFKFRAAYYNKPLMLYNTGIENRISMNVTQKPIQDWFYYNMEKYETYRSTNPEFRRYFDNLVLLYMYSYRLEGIYHQEVERILSHIDFSLQPGKWWWLYKFPGLYKLYKKTLR